MKYFAQNNQGFTLIEIVLVIGIMAILALITFGSLNSLTGQVSLDSSGQNVISELRLARSKTLASESQTSYGVHFQTDRFILFSGTIYDSSATSNKTIFLNGVEIYQITLTGGGSDVVFNRIRGTTDQNGTINARLTSDTSKTLTININSSGQASLNTTLTTSNTRVVDSRHLHFDLGWSIKTSVTLTLVFTDSPNPTVTQNIPMAGFFDAGKTVFDWSGKVTVNGSNQELRVHTHSLDSFATLLSITRDRRLNDKALTVSIDGKQIVSYTSAGVATVGAFGGSMTVQ